MTNANPFARRFAPIAWTFAAACTLAGLAAVVPALAAPDTTGVSPGNAAQAPRPSVGVPTDMPIRVPR
jgi:hypothetical protein